MCQPGRPEPRAPPPRHHGGRQQDVVDALAAQFRNAAVQRHTLAPADIGARRIGHFGVFRRDPGERAWAAMLQRIEQATPALRRALA